MFRELFYKRFPNVENNNDNIKVKYRFQLTYLSCDLSHRILESETSSRILFPSTKPNLSGYQQIFKNREINRFVPANNLKQRFMAYFNTFNTYCYK